MLLENLLNFAIIDAKRKSQDTYNIFNLTGLGLEIISKDPPKSSFRRKSIYPMNQSFGAYECERFWIEGPPNTLYTRATYANRNNLSFYDRWNIVGDNRRNTFHTLVNLSKGYDYEY